MTLRTRLLLMTQSDEKETLTLFRSNNADLVCLNLDLIVINRNRVLFISAKVISRFFENFFENFC